MVKQGNCLARHARPGLRPGRRRGECLLLTLSLRTPIQRDLQQGPPRASAHLQVDRCTEGKVPPYATIEVSFSGVSGEEELREMALFRKNEMRSPAATSLVRQLRDFATEGCAASGATVRNP